MPGNNNRRNTGSLSQHGQGNNGYYRANNHPYHNNGYHNHARGGRGGRGGINNSYRNSNYGYNSHHNSYYSHTPYSSKYNSNNNNNNSNNNSANGNISNMSYYNGNNSSPNLYYQNQSNIPFTNNNNNNNSNNINNNNAYYNETGMNKNTITEKKNMSYSARVQPQNPPNTTIAKNTPDSNPQIVKNLQLFSSRRNNTEETDTLKANPTISSSTVTKTELVDTVENNEESNFVKNETFDESLKRKPLDINSLQPMKKKKKIMPTPSQTSSTTTIETESKITDNVEKAEKIEEVEKKTALEKSDSIINKPIVKTELVHNLKKNESKADDYDYDEPILTKKRHTDISSKADQSEEDTDIEDSIPVPSRKTRRLHRLLQSAESDKEEKDTKKYKSNKSSKRSQSPKQRKNPRVGRDPSGRTLLQRMCAKGNLEEVKKILSYKNINVNDADFAGTTPLHEAALEGYYEIAELLLTNGAEIDIQSGQMDKDTPLIDAVSNLHLDVVNLLLEKGANPTLLNAQNENALDILENTLEEYDENNEEDKEALETGEQIKKALINYSRNFKKSVYKQEDKNENKSKDDDSLSSGDDDSRHVVYNSLRAGGLDSLQERITANDVTFVLNYVSSNNGSKIPPEALLLASKLGFPDIASLLIAFGADINFTDKNGWTPLMHAVGKDHLEMVKLLISNQADIKKKDRKGRNVLDILKGLELEDSEEYEILSSKFTELSHKENIVKENDKLKAKLKLKNKNKMKNQIEENDVAVDVNANDGLNDNLFSDTTSEKNTFSNKRKNNKILDSDDNEEDEDEEEKETTIGNKEIDKKNKGDEAVNEEVKQARDTNDIKKSREVSLDVVEEFKDSKENKSLSNSPSPAGITTRKVNIKQKKQHEPEESSVPPLTEEEIEAQRVKELEAKKARETLEQQRLERKKLKQQEIAKRIDAFEKQREEEKKAIELESIERKRKEINEQNQLLKEQEENRKREEMKQEIEKKKIIRSYYPFGLKQIQFSQDLNESNIKKFLPLYVFKLKSEEFVIDLQLNLILDVENLYKTYPKLNKNLMTNEEKFGVWNYLWPLIGSYKNSEVSDSVLKLQKVYNTERENFKDLVINWIKLSDLQDILDQPELHVVKNCIEKTGLCHAALTPIDTSNYNSTFVSVPVANDTAEMNDNHDVNDNDNLYILKFGATTSNILKLVNKPLW